MNSHEFRLALAMRPLSKSKRWSVAKLEWDCVDVYRLEPDRESETCLCEHYPIREICVLRNRETLREVEVGNVCVNKFIGLPSEPIFVGLRRIAANVNKGPNPALTEHAWEKGWLTEWEYDFCDSTWRKWKLTDKQARCRRKINRKILEKTKRTGIGHEG
jgi:hypothetical protein